MPIRPLDEGRHQIASWCRFQLRGLIDGNSAFKAWRLPTRYVAGHGIRSDFCRPSARPDPASRLNGSWIDRVSTTRSRVGGRPMAINREFNRIHYSSMATFLYRPPLAEGVVKSI
jgi:hypothetical protein